MTQKYFDMIKARPKGKEYHPTKSSLCVHFTQNIDQKVPCPHHSSQGHQGE